MSWRNTRQTWGSVTKSLHWGTVVALFAMYGLGIIMINMPLSPTKLEMFIWHKSIGITLLLVAVIRLAWRWSGPVPELPNDLSRRTRNTAKLGHYSLYALMIAMPLSGWVINSAANFPLSWFGLFEIPAISGPNPALEDNAKLIHLCLAIALATLVFIHISAAVYHHKIRRDPILTRML